ncbi:MAG: HAD family hydrolase [Pseudomonadota bacterium]
MRLAIFDLDSTLIEGDSDFLWGQYLVELGVVNADEYAAKNEQFFADYKAGTLDVAAFQHFSLRPLAQNTLSDLIRWRASFVADKIRPLIRPKALEVVLQHHRAGDVLLIITATNSFVTRPIADCFGIMHLIGTEPERDGNRFTGHVSGVTSFHAGKVTRLNTWLETHQLSLSDSFFYSDSHNDLPLLQTVDHPVVVNPDATLRAHANAQGWPIRDWSQTVVDG